MKCKKIGSLKNKILGLSLAAIMGSTCFISGIGGSQVWDSSKTSGENNYGVVYGGAAVIGAGAAAAVILVKRNKSKK